MRVGKSKNGEMPIGLGGTNSDGLRGVYSQNEKKRVKIPRGKKPRQKTKRTKKKKKGD